MKRLTFCIAIVAVLVAVSGLMGCNNKNDTLAQVTVTPAGQFMARNTKQQFTANGTFSNGLVLNWTQVVNWSSSNESVATVNNTAGSNGIVTSSTTTTGTTILTAFDVANNITGTTMLTVADPDSIQIMPTDSFMPINSAHQFTAIALFTGGTITITQVITTFATWTPLSLSPGVTITDTGTVTVTAGAVPGTTVIQAEDSISHVAGSTSITVKNTLLSALTVSPSNSIISLSTSTQQFSAIGTFQDGSTPTPPLTTTWAWSSSNTAVATIDYWGLATAVAAGTTTITATDPITGVSGNTTLTTIQ